MLKFNGGTAVSCHLKALGFVKVDGESSQQLLEVVEKEFPNLVSKQTETTAVVEPVMVLGEEKVSKK